MAKTYFYESVYNNSKKFIGKNLEKIKSIASKDPEEEIEGIVYSSVITNIVDIYFAMAEYKARINILGERSLLFFMEELYSKVDDIYKSIQEDASAKNMEENLEKLIQYLDGYTICNRNFSNTDDYVRHLDTDIVDFKPILDKIVLNGKNNIFHIESKNGALPYLIENAEPKDLFYYGIDSMYASGSCKEDYDSAKQSFTSVVKGSIKGARIQNDDFDMVLFNSSIRPFFDENFRLNRVTKPEKELLNDTYKYSKKNGLVLFTIPHFRLYKDVCTFIARNYSNVEIFYKEDSYNLYIVAKKAAVKDFNVDVYNLLRSLHEKENATNITDTENFKIETPSSFAEITIFNGSIFDKDDYNNMLSKNSVYENFFKSIEVNSSNVSAVRPLLPFNVGQIGLVLTSGCLDGIVDEGNGKYHLVKGRVSKKTDSTTERDGSDNETKTVVTSNRVEINILFPDGEYKTLT